MLSMVGGGLVGLVDGREKWWTEKGGARTSVRWRPGEGDVLEPGLDGRRGDAKVLWQAGVELELADDDPDEGEMVGRVERGEPELPVTAPSQRAEQQAVQIVGRTSRPKLVSNSWGWGVVAWRVRDCWRRCLDASTRSRLRSLISCRMASSRDAEVLSASRPSDTRGLDSLSMGMLRWRSS